MHSPRRIITTFGFGSVFIHGLCVSKLNEIQMKRL